MTGPYEYVAPSYWATDPHLRSPDKSCNAGGCGGAYGFNSETSMGPAIPPIESVERMVPKDHLWPVDEYWNYHAGGGAFKTVHVFINALNARYGQANSAEDFTYKSQLMTYEGVRAMYEAYSRNKYTSTGVIQWMLNNAWPSMIWHLYDYYLRPGGGYFGAKKALQALDPIYGYDDHSVWLVSSQYVDARGLKLAARVFNLDGLRSFPKASRLMLQPIALQEYSSSPKPTAYRPLTFSIFALQMAMANWSGQIFIGSRQNPKPSTGQNLIGIRLRPTHMQTTPHSHSRRK